MTTLRVPPFSLRRPALLAVALQSVFQLAYAGPGTVNGIKTYYANSPAGTRYAPDDVNHQYPIDTGKPLRKFVDTLPPLGCADGQGNATTNSLGQCIPIAVPDTATYPGDDYYEIGVVEYEEQMHSDLVDLVNGAEQGHKTKLRGYVQLNAPAGNAAGIPHYLGPTIIAQRNRPVRIKYTNLLPVGINGTLFIPVDTSYSGAGEGPLDAGGNPCDPVTQTCAAYTQNRAEIHLHGGFVPWISDGTPHQWITPANENTPYRKGASQQNVPDMPIPPNGSATLYYPNDQSGRLMFYHDHAFGLTRLNVYAGEAAGYLLTDPLERLLTTGGRVGNVTLPALAGEIPLIIQDKGFVPQDIAVQDSKWLTPPTDLHTGGQIRWGQPGDLWYPHVYEFNQDPNAADGSNPMGRWDYGPYFWPVFPVQSTRLIDLLQPGSTEPSGTPEAFMDTPVINGTAYPTLEVEPKAYRFRILNASNDRMINLGLYEADPNILAVDENGNRVLDNQGKALTNTEVAMVPAVPHTATSTSLNNIQFTNGGNGYPDYMAVTVTIDPPQTQGGQQATAIAWHDPTIGTSTGNAGPLNQIFLTNPGSGYTAAPKVTVASQFGGSGAMATVSLSGELLACPDGVTQSPKGAGACWPSTWPIDGRAGGVPDPRRWGPDFIQIGSEGGLLPQPAVIESTPMGYEYNRRSVTVLNVFTKGVFLGAAERADVIVDFSQFAGKTLILYNDGPAPTPAFDARVDYYTGDPDQSVTGGAPSTRAGYGPNTRTMMQIKVKATTPAAPYPVAALDTALPAIYAATQEPPALAQTPYNGAAIANPAKFGQSQVDPNDLSQYGRIYVGSSNQPFWQFQDGSGHTVSAGVPKPTGQLASAKDYVQCGGLTPDPIPKPPVKDCNIDSTIPIHNKAIQELFDPVYGKMNATLGVELPFTSALIQTTIPLGYIDPVTETLPTGNVQIWKITHNGVDSHPVHFHLVNVQLLNRIGWDGTVKPPDANETGWKETIRMNPLEDVIVAVRAKLPKVPFNVPDSKRLLDPTQPAGTKFGFTQVDPNTNNPAVVTNVMGDFGWEYVWHCHILGHEENDFMRSIAVTNATGYNIADKVAPAVSASVAPPPNAAGWITSTSTVTLAATDPVDPVKPWLSSGVASIGYALNGGTPVTVKGATASITGLPEGTTTITYWATDNAATPNTGTGTPVTVQVDTVAPLTSVSLPQSPNTGGWYNQSTATVTITATDAGSGIASITVNGVTTPGSTAAVDVNTVGSTVLTYYATDNSGNQSALQTVTVRMENTLPIITGSWTPTPNANGWNKSDVTVHFTATDAQSGIFSVTPDTILSTEGANQSVTGTAVDNAGNSASTTVSGINIDKTAPVVNGAVPAPNAAGWYGRWSLPNSTAAISTTNVLTLGFTAGSTDNLSGIATVSPATWSRTTPTGTGGVNVNVSATDKAGNSATKTVNIKIDTTLPTISATRSPATANGLNGWYTVPVTVTFTASDTQSGLASVSPAVTLSANRKGQSVTGQALDIAGNSASRTATGINIDLAAPNASAISVTAAAPSGTTQSVTFSGTITDGTSGVASSPWTLVGNNGTTVSGSVTPGVNGAFTVARTLTRGVTYTFTVTPLDLAGNIGSVQSYSYLVP